MQNRTVIILGVFLFEWHKFDDYSNKGYTKVEQIAHTNIQAKLFHRGRKTLNKIRLQYTSSSLQHRVTAYKRDTATPPQV